MNRMLPEIGQGKMDYSINCAIAIGQPLGNKRLYSHFISGNSKWIKDLDMKIKQ